MSRREKARDSVRERALASTKPRFDDGMGLEYSRNVSGSQRRRMERCVLTYPRQRRLRALLAGRRGRLWPWWKCEVHNVESGGVRGRRWQDARPDRRGIFVNRAHDRNRKSIAQDLLALVQSKSRTMLLFPSCGILHHATRAANKQDNGNATLKASVSVLARVLRTQVCRHMWYFWAP